ncbi:MAG TPA: hypothetical protein VFZ08_02215, partial [Terriglobia bacterium]|nr:hypothetical protein [Terriglobia bacterium]
FWRLSRSLNGKTAFWGALLFSFWCGECVQLLAADAYTYWRNMIVFLALMGLVLNWAERDRVRPSFADLLSGGEGSPHFSLGKSYATSEGWHAPGRISEISHEGTQ